MCAPLDYRWKNAPFEKNMPDESWQEALLVNCFPSSSRLCTTAKQVLEQGSEKRVAADSTWAKLRALALTPPEGMPCPSPGWKWARQPDPQYQNAASIPWCQLLQERIRQGGGKVQEQDIGRAGRRAGTSSAFPTPSRQKSRSPRLSAPCIAICLMVWEIGIVN